jgi:hypothetical protein
VTHLPKLHPKDASQNFDEDPQHQETNALEAAENLRRSVTDASDGPANLPRNCPEMGFGFVS